MQWSSSPNAGFSTAEPTRLISPIVADGPFSFETTNVTDQRRDADSMLVWFERMLHTLRECPEAGVGQHTVVKTHQHEVFVHRADAPSGAVLFLHNLSDQPQTVSVPARDSDEPPLEFFSDQEYAEPDLDGLELGPYGYRWLRLRRTHARW